MKPERRWTFLVCVAALAAPTTGEAQDSGAAGASDGPSAGRAGAGAGASA